MSETPLLETINAMTDEEVALTNRKLQKTLIIKMVVGAAAIVAGHIIAKKIDEKYL